MNKVIMCAMCAIMPMVCDCFAQTAEQKIISKAYSMTFGLKPKRFVIKHVPWRTDWGSSDKIKYNALSYDVNVRCNSHAMTNWTIEVIWMASKSDGRAFPVEIEEYKLPEAVKKNEKTTVGICSKLFIYREAKYVALGEQTKEGYILKGAIVRLKSDDGHIIRSVFTQYNDYWRKLAWEENVVVKEELDNRYIHKPDDE